MGEGAERRGGLVAFLGPSLPAETARRIVPDVVLLPPVCQGDLASVVLRLAPRAVLVVDGEFSQSLAVWHKEVLYALDRDVRVLGASSMGALRAAELDRYGMEGVGEIYAHYRDGWLTADADVALLHGDPDDGYRGYTWPMVNVRATVRALVRDEVVAEQEAETLLAAAGALHFSERTEPAMARALARSGVEPRRADALAGLLTQRYVDQKASDAVAAFELLARLDDVPPPDRDRPRHVRGRGFEALLSGDVTLRRRAGEVRGYQLVDDVALHDPDYERLLHRAVDRHLAVHLAADTGQWPDDDELAATRARLLARWGVTEESLPAWLDSADLDEERLAALVLHEAIQRKMRRWMLDGVALERNRRMVIEQLHLDGGYAAAADAAARRRSWADARPVPRLPETVVDVADLVNYQHTVSGWSPGASVSLPEYADEMGFDSLGGLYVALADAREASQEQHERRTRMSRTLGLSAPTPPPGPGVRLHAMLEAHQVTQVLLAAVELGVPDALGAGSADVAALAARLELHPGRLGRLLACLSVLGVVERDGDLWALSEDGRLLTAGEDADEPSLATYAVHVREELLDTWSGLAEAIRGAGPPAYPVSEVADQSIDAAAHVWGLGVAVADVLDPPVPGRLADIGGGLGSMAHELVVRHPGLEVVVLELPDTAARAAERLSGRGTADRVRVVPFTGQDRLDQPVDVCLLVRVLATLDDTQAVRLLELARHSLAPGGRVEVVEAEADGSAAAALTDLLNLVRSGGAVRSPDGWRRLAARAGLRLETRAPFVSPFVHYTYVPAGEGT
jgi:precorrin-6B methylase 2